MKKVSESLGWIGIILILLSYGLLSFSILDSQSVIYQLFNLLGALGIVTDAYYKKDRPVQTLNIIWAAIATIILLKIILHF